MNQIGNFLQVEKKETKFKNERQELIQNFVDNINREREGTAYKPVSWQQINGMLRMMGNSELYIFYKECENYNGAFSKRFFGGFKKQSWREH